MQKITIFLFAVLFVASFPVVCQPEITGRVVDDETGEPIPFANIFFANTLLGTTTNTDGTYRLAGFPPGKYDLTITYVGYGTVQQAILFDHQSRLKFDTSLKPEPVVLSEIMVKPDTVNWKRNFEDFKYHFLGTSQFAKSCVIKNPRDVFLYYDAKDATLVAYARDPIVVENSATGYIIRYYLKKFEYNARSGLFIIYGVPQFEEMSAANNRQARGWRINRDKIYYGSLQHFMQSWLAGSWPENKFKVSRLYRVNNRKRPSDEWLSQKLSKYGFKTSGRISLQLSASGDGSGQDSLQHFLRLKSLPKVIDSLVDESLTGKEFRTSTGPAVQQFQGLFQVTHRDLEEEGYAAQVGRPHVRRPQQSIIHIKAPIHIYDNGYYEDVYSVLIENYWSWSEKISTLLPLGYKPATKK